MHYCSFPLEIWNPYSAGYRAGLWDAGKIGGDVGQKARLDIKVAKSY